MGRSRAHLGAGCVGVLAGFALAAAPASQSHRAGGPLSMPTGAAMATTTGTQSEYLGGYEVVQPEGISSAGSTFRLPKFSCPVTGVIQHAGFGEFLNNAAGDLYQDGGGTDAYAVGSITCSFGEPEYTINADTAGGTEADQDMDINQGDLIQTRVEELPSGNAVATVNDLTSGQQVSSQGPSNGDDVQMYEGIIPDVYDEVFDNSLTIPKFKTVELSRSQVGGLHLSQVDPIATVLDQDGPVMVTPSAIAAHHPGAFTLTEKHDN